MRKVLGEGLENDMGGVCIRRTSLTNHIVDSFTKTQSICLAPVAT